MKHRPPSSDTQPTMSHTMPQAIRLAYEKWGVEKYYQQYGADYSNPHQHYIFDLLQQTHTKINYSQVLDLCCGAGEVTSSLRTLGYDDVTGCDPFTQAAYLQKTGLTCLPFDFKQIAQGALSGTHYSTIICSFALHLCPPSLLYTTLYQLFECTSHLVIITPHKRPDLGIYPEFECFEQAISYTRKKKAVRLKAYRRVSQ